MVVMPLFSTRGVGQSAPENTGTLGFKVLNYAKKSMGVKTGKILYLFKMYVYEEIRLSDW